jgi:hypothetical protein
MRVIAVGQRLFGDIDRAAGAFGDVLPGHLGMDAAACVPGTVDGEEAAHLGQDTVEGESCSRSRLDRVAVHRVARPDDRMPSRVTARTSLGRCASILSWP